MAKTKEELEQLSKQLQDVQTKLNELDEGELKYIAAGMDFNFEMPENGSSYEQHFYHDDVQDFKK